MRDAFPKPQPLATAELKTVRLRLIKVAARITETASRVRISFASCCPEAELFGGIARWFQPAARDRRGKRPKSPDLDNPQRLQNLS